MKKKEKIEKLRNEQFVKTFVPFDESKYESVKTIKRFRGTDEEFNEHMNNLPEVEYTPEEMAKITKDIKDKTQRFLEQLAKDKDENPYDNSDIEDEDDWKQSETLIYVYRTPVGKYVFLPAYLDRIIDEELLTFEEINNRETDLEVVRSYFPDEDVFKEKNTLTYTVIREF